MKRPSTHPSCCRNAKGMRITYVIRCPTTSSCQRSIEDRCDEAFARRANRKSVLIHVGMTRRCHTPRRGSWDVLSTSNPHEHSHHHRTTALGHVGLAPALRQETRAG